MEKSEYRKNAADMIYLTACAINGKKPRQARIDALDLPKLFEVCQEHILTACTAYALESAGIKDGEFVQAKEKAIRKNIILDAERLNLFRRLESEKIWYMPLKGAILKDWYPRIGMRQMSDNDILFDSTQRSRMREIMLDLGFECSHYGKENDDAYFKAPVCNFEMHAELFCSAHIGNLYGYFSKVDERLIKDEGNEYGYHLSSEDFYLFMTAHEYKHFTNAGTGVRSLVDTYIFLRKFNSKLDWHYIKAELKKLGIADFERRNRELAIKVFSMKQLTIEDKRLLCCYVMSGAYGNKEIRMENAVKYRGNGSKVGYMKYRLLPSVGYLELSVPWVKKSRSLIPAAVVYRYLRKIKNDIKRKLLTEKNCQQHKKRRVR